MGKKKVVAYVSNDKDEYLRNKDGTLKTVWIYDALRLRSNDPHTFRKLTFKSFHRNPEQRKKVFPVKNGFFRYEKGADIDPSDDVDANSLSHSMAIAVLSQMREFRFIQGNNSLCIRAKEVRSEDVKIQLTNRNKFQYYFPDLICIFDEPRELSIKWGGKLAIEVKDTHGCEPEKVYDFENHGIPIIQVSLNNLTLKDRIGTDFPTPTQLENYHRFLRHLFSKKIYCQVLSDPVSKKFYELSTRRIKNKYEKGYREQWALIEKLREKIVSQDEGVRRLSKLNDINQSELKKRKTYIEELEKRGIWYHLRKILFT